MEDYEKLKNFWNKTFENITENQVYTKFCDSELFTLIIKNYVHSDSNVLDFGTGSGWGLFETYAISKFNKGIGIDTSINAINYASETAELLGYKNMKFICGDENLLDNYKNKFDFIISTNTLDVVTEEITVKMLEKLKAALKDNGVMLISLNPAFTEEFLVNNVHMEKQEKYFYKDGILRCNYKSVAEWEKFFKTNNLEIILSSPYKLFSQEKYERRMYLLRKIK